MPAALRGCLMGRLRQQGLFLRRHRRPGEASYKLAGKQTFHDGVYILFLFCSGADISAPSPPLCCTIIPPNLQAVLTRGEITVFCLWMCYAYLRTQPGFLLSLSHSGYTPRGQGRPKRKGGVHIAPRPRWVSLSGQRNPPPVFPATVAALLVWSGCLTNAASSMTGNVICFNDNR